MLTSQQWIDAAYASVRDRPDATVTINGVADTLEATKGSFYHHFNSRAELVLEVLARHERDTEAIVDGAGDVCVSRVAPDEAPMAACLCASSCGEAVLTGSGVVSAPRHGGVASTGCVR